MKNDSKAAALEKLREQAETRVASQPDTKGFINEAFDLKRLLHELQIYRLELEMQNEELRQAIAERNEMEALLGTYRDLYDFAPVGYFTLDPFGSIQAVNRMGAAFLGVEGSLLLKNRFDGFVDSETRPLFHDFLEKVFTSEAKETCEVVIVKQGQAPLDVQIEAVVSKSGGNCRAVVVDISERKQSDNELTKITRRLEALMAAVPVGISFSDDITCQHITGNPAVLQQFSISSWDNLSASALDVDAPGRKIRFFLDGREISAAELPLQRAVAENKAIPPMELKVLMPNGKQWYAEVSGAPMIDSSGNVIGGLAVTEDITVRKLIEQSLQQSMEEWERTFDSVPDLIAILDNQHRIVRVNQAMANQLNLKPAECIGLPCYTVIHGANVPPSFCPHSRSLADLEEHESLVEETVFGGVFLVSTTPLFDSAGEMYASVHVARDITRLSQMEKELCDNEERLRFHLDNSPMAVVEWDKDFNVTLWTGQSEQLFGWSAAETVGKPFAELNMTYEADIPLVGKTIVQLTDGVTERVVTTNRNVTKNGELRYCTWYNSVKYDEQRRMTSVLSKIIDITSLKLVEMEKQKFISLVEHSDEFIGICGLDLVPFYVNDAALQLAGFDSLEELFRVSVLDFFYPEDRSFIENEFLPQVFKNGHNEVEIRFRNFKTGLPVWMIYSVFYLLDNEGEPVALATVSRDISQRKLAEEELKAAHLELEKKVVERTMDLATTVAALRAEIVERERAEAALETSAKEIEDLFNLAPCGYHSVDINGLFVRINDTELEWLGYGRDEIVGKVRTADIMTPESRVVYELNFARLIAGSSIADLRLDFIRKDSSILPAMLNASPILDENGKFLMSRSTIYDITALSLAEEKIRRLNQLYLTLSETGKSIARMTDRHSLFEDICRIAVECGGFRLAWIGLVDEVSGQVEPLSFWGDCAHYLDNIRISTGLEPEGSGPTGTAIREGGYYICNNFFTDPCTGPWRTQAEKCGFFASASLAILLHGKSIGALTIYAGVQDYFDAQIVDLLVQMQADISFALENLELEQRSREIEKSLQEETLQRLQVVETLRQKELLLIQQSRHAAMGEMIGNIAHQWRQPLNTLGLFTQRLGLFYDSPDFTKEFLDTSVAKSMEIIQYMSRTIDDFRSFFSTERERVAFRVDEVLSRALSLVEAGFKECMIRVERNESENVTIYGFPNEYAQVLLNILINAKDVILERNTVSPRVSITVSNENGVAVVTIADNAGGIHEDIMDNVFDPYFTTKGPQRGTGVGLFMSRTIIETNMGGSLTVRNTAEGAEFRIEV